MIAKLKAWLIPFVLAILAVAAVNKARKKQKQVNRAYDRIEQATENDIDDLASDVEANVAAHKDAQAKAKEAKDNAKKRISDLAGSDDDMSDLLDKYRMRS